MFITIDGVQYEVQDSALASAIQKTMKDHEKEVETLKASRDTVVKEKEDAEKERDEANAKADTASKDQMSEDQISSLVSDQVELVVEAKTILGDKMPSCMNCPKEIRQAVVEDVFPDLDLSDKSDTYIEAAYDMAVKKISKGKETNQNLGRDFEAKPKTLGNDEARSQARDNWVKGLTGEEK